MAFDYYAQQPDHLFDEMKKLAIEIRETYDNTYGYSDEKIDRIKNIHNIRDNIRYIFGMFDIHNQNKLVSMASNELKNLILQTRDESGNVFLIYNHKF